jgi:autophagy-related protein 18
MPPPGSTKPSHVPPGGVSYHGLEQSSGDVRIFDATKLEAVNTIQAHQSSIGSLALNNDATLLATASGKGTVIRVFTVLDGQTLFQFRRGSLPAPIFSMSFNATSTLLCVSSATETVHIFRLVDPKNSLPTTPTSPSAPFPGRRFSASSQDLSGNASDENAQDSCAIEESPPPTERKGSGFTGGFGSMIRQTSQSFAMGVASRVGGYLPNSVTQALEPQRDFAHVKIPRVAAQNSTAPLRSIVAMSANHPQLFVVTSEGTFAIFNIDLEKGGEGVLERKHS